MYKPAVQKIFHGSYRTYEEWKHELNEIIWQSKTVLTVPMRNGNATTVPVIGTSGLFVLTVPMRNGNDFVQFVLRIIIQFLPYL